MRRGAVLRMIFEALEQATRMCVCVTSPYPLRCSRAARGHPAAAGGRGAARRPNRRGPRATPPGSWWWKAGSPSSSELVPAVDQP